MIYIVAAYAAIWVLTFVFIASIFVRQTSLRRDLDLAEQLLQSLHEKG